MASWSTPDPVPARRARIRGGGDCGDRRPVEVLVDPGRVQIVLWLLTGSLVTLNVLVSLFSGLHLLPYGLVRVLDGNDRDSFLGGANTVLLLLAAVLMTGGTIVARRRGDSSLGACRVLALATWFAFVDDLTGLRSWLAEVLGARYHLHGVGRYAWAVVYLPVAVAVLIVLVRDLWRVPGAVRNRLLPGLALYAIGIIGLEPAEAMVAEGRGAASLSFRITTAIADGTALIGLTFVISALLVAATRTIDAVTLVLAAPDPSRRPIGAPDAAGSPPGPGSPSSPARHP
ncbi:MAG TPA: hypothetical protein VI248_26070 [Kineosporiaceae bacterium]